MPKPVTFKELAAVVLTYVIKRQRQGRPTTLRQVSKRVSMGVPTVLHYLDLEKVNYIILAYGNDQRDHKTEIAIRSIPAALAARMVYTVAQVEESYRAIFGEGETPVVYKADPANARADKAGLLRAEVVNDPYGPYRIDSESYRALKKNLIAYDELIKLVRERGIPGSAAMRAVGGDKLRYPLASPVWRPYIYRNHRFYHKDVLKHLDEVYTTYKHPAYGERKKKYARVVQGEKERVR